MVVRGLVRRVVRGVVRRVVRGVGSVGSPRSGGQFFQLSHIFKPRELKKERAIMALERFWWGHLSIFCGIHAMVHHGWNTATQNRFIAEPLHDGIVTYLRENGDSLMPENLVMTSLYTYTSAMMLRKGEGSQESARRGKENFIADIPKHFGYKSHGHLDFRRQQSQFFLLT